MDIIYNNTRVDNNFINPNNCRENPDVSFNIIPNNYYTLLMYDSNAISGKYIHWLVINIKSFRCNEDGIEKLPYEGPKPPNNSGIHNYIFELYKQPYIYDENILINKSRLQDLNIIKRKLKLNAMNLIDRKQFISYYINGGVKRKINKSNKKTIKNYKRKKLL